MAGIAWLAYGQSYVITIILVVMATRRCTASSHR